MTTENNTMTVENLMNDYPEIVAQMQDQARQGMFTKAGLESAISLAKEGMIPSAQHTEAVSAAAEKSALAATSTERDRIMAIHASCQGSNAAVMFESLVLDGCTEQQANRRIQDVLAMRSDDIQISSRHSGGGFAKKQFPAAADIYAGREGR